MGSGCEAVDETLTAASGGDVRPCQRILPVYGRGLRARWRRLRRRPIDWEACGLAWGHYGGCVSFIPGGYLRAPLVHPLDLWLACCPWWSRRTTCPVGCVARCISTEGPIHDMVFENGEWLLHDVVMEWRFDPCGHTFREVVEEGADDHTAHVG